MGEYCLLWTEWGTSKFRVTGTSVLVAGRAPKNRAELMYTMF
jgi:hypothetical protein